MQSLFSSSDALVSDCGQYRYWLSRTWDTALSPATFIMLNPSTADASLDDPTIRRCRSFAERFHCGSLMVVNLFAYRATDPDKLRKAFYPVGPENDEWIRKCVRSSEHGKVIAAWGAKSGKPVKDRIWQVRGLLREIGLPVWCLDRTRDGSPQHPLFVRRDAELRPYL